MEKRYQFERKINEKKKKTNGNYKWKKKKRQLLKDDNYSELMRR